MKTLNKIAWNDIFCGVKCTYKKYLVIIQNNYVTIRDRKKGTYKNTLIVGYSETLTNIKKQIKASCNA